MKRLIIGALGATLLAGSAQACEEMEGGGTFLSNSQFPVRGFSYWTDKSPVTLIWNTGEVVAQVSPDDNGEFSLTVAAPTQPGIYTLTARQNRDDSEPVTITVKVLPQQTTDAQPAAD